MSVIATTTAMDNDEELHLNARIWEDLHKKGFEGFGKNSDDESDGSEESEDENSDEGSEEESDDDDSEVDDKVKAINKMAKEMEDNIAGQKEYESRIDRRMARSEYKKKALIEQQRLLKEDMSVEDELANDDLLSNDDEYEPLLPRSTLKDGQDVESEGHSSSGEENNFVNPLLKKKTIDLKGEVSEGEWSDDGDEKVVDKKKQKKDKKLLGKRKRADSDEDKVQEFFVDDKIEVVPANDPGTL